MLVTSEFVWAKMSERGEFAGQSWSNILVQELVEFHGCTLKICVDHHHIGGYHPYFTDPVSDNLSRNYFILLKDYPTQTQRCFSPQRSKQIQADFHPGIK